MGIFNATATYGSGFKPTHTPHCLLIRIYTGGFAGQKTADARLAKEIKSFLHENDYTSHTIVSRKRKWIPSYYEYEVQFGRDAVHQFTQADGQKQGAS